MSKFFAELTLDAAIRHPGLGHVADDAEEVVEESVEQVWRSIESRAVFGNEGSSFCSRSNHVSDSEALLGGD